MYELQKNRWLKHMDFAVLDVLVLEGLYFVLIRLMIPPREYRTFGVHKHVALAIPVIALLLFMGYDFYKRILRRSVLHELASCFQYMLFLAGGILIYLYLSKESYWFSRALFITFSLTGVPVLLLVRSLYKQVVIRRLSRAVAEMILITDRPLKKKLLKKIEKAGMRCRLAAVFSDVPGDVPFDCVYPMNFQEVEQYRNAHVIDEVILDFASQKEYEKWCSFLLDSGLTVHVCIEDLMNDLPNAFIERIGDLTVLSASNSVANPGKLIIKRLMDIGGSIVGLSITGIAFIILAPIIKIQSPGPVFYSQIRVGRNGRQFRIYKFRSMYPDADARKEELLAKNKMDGQMFKMDDDPRIIPIGRFIRRHSVDELPQFWNVLKGDMSLVGTRPPTLDEWERYSPHHRARMSMKPGLTGKWQVSGRSDITDFEEIVRLDTEYINNWSILTDLKLIGRTIFVVFRGDGAA